MTKTASQPSPEDEARRRTLAAYRRTRRSLIDSLKQKGDERLQREMHRLQGALKDANEALDDGRNMVFEMSPHEATQSMLATVLVYAEAMIELLDEQMGSNDMEERP